MTTHRTRPVAVLPIALLALAASAVLLAGCASGHEDVPARPVAPVTVRTARVAVATHTRTVDVGGVIRARTTATVAARVVAPVRVLHVKAGDAVRAGQTLVTLEGDDLAAQVRAAEAARSSTVGALAAARAEERAARAAVGLATATFTRIEGLRARKSATAQEFDEATAAVRAAESRLEAATARVGEASAGVTRAEASRDAASATASFLRVVSPFDGVVTETLVERGDMATPGLPLVRVEDTSRFRVEARVDQARATALNTGAAIEVVLDSPNGPSVASATIAEIARAVDADAHTVLVKAWLPEGTVARSGTFVRLRLAADTRRSMTVPPEALLTHGQITSAFVIEDGTARLRLVRARGTEIEAGLVEGDTVIVSPPAHLTDGRPVSTGGPR